MRRRIFFVSRRADVPYLNSLHQEHLCMRNMLVCTNIAVLAPLSEAWKLHEGDLDFFLFSYRCTSFPLISKAFAGASCCTALGDLWASVALEASPNTAHSGKQAQQWHLQRGCLSWLAPRANQVRGTLDDIQLSPSSTHRVIARSVLLNGGMARPIRHGQAWRGVFCNRLTWEILNLSKGTAASTAPKTRIHCVCQGQLLLYGKEICLLCHASNIDIEF